MKKEFIPYEQNLEIRNLGFDEPCIGFYNIDLDVIPIDSEPYTTKSKDGAILYQQAFRWFREKYDLFGCIDLQACSPSHWFIRIDKIEINDYLYHSEDENVKYNTYEEAELACLKMMIKISKTNECQ